MKFDNYKRYQEEMENTDNKNEEWPMINNDLLTNKSMNEVSSSELTE